MTEKSLPWANTSPGDAGPYTDSDWSTMWRRLIGDGNQRVNSGLLRGSGNQALEALKVVQTAVASGSVLVKPGAALVQGKFYSSDADVTLAIAANSSGNPRIDTIILRRDNTAQTVRLVVLQGTPAASPVRPTLTQSVATWEIPIADIAVANAFTGLTDANITMYREYANSSDTVILDDILNNSGVELLSGDVVVWDTSADRAVTTTTTENSEVAGVWIGLTAAGGYGRVMKRGIQRVRMNNTVTARGQYLISSTVAKAANQYGAPAWNAFGTTLEAAADSSGRVLCDINVGGVKRFSGCRLRNSNNISTTSVAALRYTDMTYNTEDYDTDSYHENVTNPTRITLPCPGKFRLSAFIELAASAVGLRGTGIRKNGSALQVSTTTNAMSAGATSVEAICTIDGVAGDYFELGVLQNSGGALNLTGGVGYSPVFECELIG